MDNWEYTSCILALLANVNRDPKKGKPFQPRDFNPYAKKPKRVDDINLLKDMVLSSFAKKKPKKRVEDLGPLKDTVLRNFG